jgi:hypothetical protein
VLRSNGNGFIDIYVYRDNHQSTYPSEIDSPANFALEPKAQSISGDWMKPLLDNVHMVCSFSTNIPVAEFEQSIPL